MSQRIRYFLAHLCISTLVGLMLIGMVFFVWYPFPLAKAVGVTQIILILITVDVIIGPLLSLLVYKVGKKTLKKDLLIIILLQITALIYGLYNIVSSRPSWIVQNGDVFELVRYNQILIDEDHQIADEYQSPSWFRPQWVAIQSLAQKDESFVQDAIAGIPTSIKPYRYTSLSHESARLQEYSQDLKHLTHFNPPNDINTTLKQFPNADAWMPLRTGGIDMVVLIDKKNAAVLEIVDLRPWN